jgi:hypothetical protein
MFWKFGQNSNKWSKKLGTGRKLLNGSRNPYFRIIAAVHEVRYKIESQKQ